MRSTLTIIFSLLFFCKANACDCSPGNLQTSFAASDGVLKVKVLSITDTVHYDLFSKPTGRPPFNYGTRPELKIQQIYKGSLASEKIVLGSSGGMCDFNFSVNTEYVIFVSKVNGVYMTSVCVENFEAKDREALREVQALANKYKSER